jgi:ADP-ribosylation factor-binding protein GGA
MSAHPKIQKMCEEESDDHEAVAKLLEINDSINRTIERYRLVKKGDVAGAAKIPKGTLGISGAGVSKGPNNELSLIDLGEEDDARAAPQDAPAAPRGGSTLADDLLGLSLDPELPATGEISLGGSNGFGECLIARYDG